MQHERSIARFRSAVKLGIEKIWNKLGRNVAQGNLGKTAPQYVSEGKEFRVQCANCAEVGTCPFVRTDTPIVVGDCDRLRTRTG